LPRRLRSREDFANAQPPCRFVEFLSGAPLAIAKQIARRTVPRIQPVQSERSFW
jgi:hypothetical protein